MGLPVAVEFAEAGFHVVGVDSSRELVQSLKRGHSHILDVPDDAVSKLHTAGRLTASDSYDPLAEADAVLICVPTPMFDGTPDLTAIRSAGGALGEVLTPDTLVVLESTTYPGTTEEVLLPLLESRGLVAGRDFLLAYSPERIDPANPQYGFADIPKVVGGVTMESTKAAEALYAQVVPKIVTVSGTREAELAKLIENTFRHVNIALIDELALYAYELGIDIWESIEAAATKPFGFLPFWPGPGWGGHCIPLDPSFLSWRVRKNRSHEIRFVELAHTLNAEMRHHVVERVMLLLNDGARAARGAKVLGVGVAYKGGIDDIRHSPALNVLSALADLGAEVIYHDPLVPSCSINHREVGSSELSPELLRDQDIVVILAPQVGVDWKLVTRESSLVLDCCNALGMKGNGIYRL